MLSRVRYSYMSLFSFAKIVPTARLELAIFGLGDRRLIHWATQAVLNSGTLLQISPFSVRSIVEYWVMIVYRTHGVSLNSLLDLLGESQLS